MYTGEAFGVCLARDLEHDMSTVIACGWALNKMVTEGYLEKVLAIALPLEEVEGAVNQMVTEGYLEKALAIALPLEEVERAVEYETCSMFT